MADFLDSDTFADWAKSPEWSESDLAQDLLTVVSGWIRDHKPDVSDDDPAARIVCFEVTRDALMYGDFGPVTSFSKTVGHRARAATIDRAALERFILDRHKRMLGLSIGVKPAYYFGD